MGIETGIEWTDATWNPWVGCTKVSEACDNCYMFADMARYGRKGDVVARTRPPTFNLPLAKDRDGNFKLRTGTKVFTCSWSDWLHDAADPWRDEAWAIIRKRPDVTFQIVTKRTSRISKCLPADWGPLGYPNVWLIATTENQKWADRRIPQLLKVPAAVHGISAEPLLGRIDISDYLPRYDFRPTYGYWKLLNPDCDGKPILLRRGIDWGIVGGESGKHARPMHPKWARDLRDQCVEADVAYFFKQWGCWMPSDALPIPAERPTKVLEGTPSECVVMKRPSQRVRVVRADGGDRVFAADGTFSGQGPQQGDAWMTWVGNKAPHRELDGVEWSQFPEVARCDA